MSRPDLPTPTGATPAPAARHAHPRGVDQMNTSANAAVPVPAGPAAGGEGPWARPPGSRPSPRPRPTAAAPPGTPAPTPDAVTVGNSPVSSGESETAPTAVDAEENGVEVSSLQPSLHSKVDTLREQVRSGLVAVRAYVTPPSVLVERPASVAELSAYAHWGTWTAEAGVLRNLGIAWYRLAGLPVTVICRYVEWIVQRPGRALVVFALVKLLLSTGPGPWVADHLIRPVLGAVAWVLL